MFRTDKKIEAVKKKAPLKTMKYVIDRQYFIAPETKTFIISRNRNISFTLIFKYLGSWISYDLDDTYDINSRIKRVHQAMGALNFVLVIRKSRPSIQILNLHGCSLKPPPLGL